MNGLLLQMGLLSAAANDWVIWVRLAAAACDTLSAFVSVHMQSMSLPSILFTDGMRSMGKYLKGTHPQGALSKMPKENFQLKNT